MAPQAARLDSNGAIETVLPSTAMSRRDPCKDVPPRVVSKIVSRCKAMVLRLLPLQVEEDDITAANGSICTPEAVKAFYKAGGDFNECVPYALLVARHSFLKEAYSNPSDYDEHMNHKTACEVLARRVVQQFDKDRQHLVLSTRYTHIESDGDVSLPLSAIELASDSHCPIFLSSGESQKTIFALWKGHLIQGKDSKGHTIYQIWQRKSGLDPARLAVPRYQNILRIALWILFIIAYTFAIQTPDREWGIEDYILYIQVAGYMLEEVVRIIKIKSIAAITFWTSVSLIIYTIILVALGYRVADIISHSEKKSLHYRLRSFQILSCAAPLIWAKLLTVFDLFSFFGSMQIVLARMMKESAVFFTLLAILSAGFLQALTGLDIADNSRDATGEIIHSLLQGLLGSPNFELYDGESLSYPFGMVLYYAWSTLTMVILLNILVALFNSSYEAVASDTIAQYMAFFAQKTIAGVRAPDQWVYVSPFNLVEAVILPLEFCLSTETYNRINEVLLTILFFPVLCAIALFERRFESKIYLRLEREMSLEGDDDEDDYEENPEVNDEGVDGQISKVDFEDLVKEFPDLTTSTSAQILKEVRNLRKELAQVKKEVEESKVKKEEDA